VSAQQPERTAKLELLTPGRRGIEWEYEHARHTAGRTARWRCWCLATAFPPPRVP